MFLPGESQGLGSLVGCCLWGRTDSDTTEVTKQQQQQQLFLIQKKYLDGYCIRRRGRVDSERKTRFLHGDEKAGPLISKLLNDFGIISLSFLCLVNLIVSGITVQQVL